MQKKRNLGVIIGILIVVLIALILISIAAGRYVIRPAEILQLFKTQIAETFHIGMASGTTNKSAATVLFQSRLPRIIAAMLIGCALSVSGASYQGIFKNPMVSPDLLGASAGAGCGAALGLLLSLPNHRRTVFSIWFWTFIRGDHSGHQPDRRWKVGYQSDSAGTKRYCGRRFISGVYLHYKICGRSF